MLLNNRVLCWNLDESTGASRVELCASSEVYEPMATAFKTTFTSAPGPASLDGASSFSKLFFARTRSDDRLRVTMMSAEVITCLYFPLLRRII